LYKPEFSVVVPTHGRVHLVERLLRSLHDARFLFQNATEVLIVDSSSSNDAKEIQDMCNKWNCRYFRGENKVGHKRNIGINYACYDIIFFTDSDCEVQPNIFQAHSSSYITNNNSVSAVLGLTEWNGAKGSLWNILPFTSALTAAFSFAAWFPKVPWGTCTNLSVKREALIAVDGFDEKYPGKVYGEDVDLGLRLTLQGYTIYCNPHAIVKHSREMLTTFSQGIRKTFRTGRADYYLGEKHSERLSAEFPGPLIIVMLLLCVGILRVFLGNNIRFFLAPLLWLPFFVIASAILTGLIEKNKGIHFFSRSGAVLLEVSFEAGRLFESLIHGSIKRAWTKFVYIDQQLMAERRQKIIQIWVALIGFLLLILFL